jgi:hypothetical protein
MISTIETTETAPETKATKKAAAGARRAKVAPAKSLSRGYQEKSEVRGFLRTQKTEATRTSTAARPRFRRGGDPVGSKASSILRPSCSEAWQLAGKHPNVPLSLDQRNRDHPFAYCPAAMSEGCFAMKMLDGKRLSRRISQRVEPLTP